MTLQDNLSMFNLSLHDLEQDFRAVIPTYLTYEKIMYGHKPWLLSNQTEPEKYELIYVNIQDGLTFSFDDGDNNELDISLEFAKDPEKYLAQAREAQARREAKDREANKSVRQQRIEELQRLLNEEEQEESQ